jgi:hypothetical protein
MSIDSIIQTSQTLHASQIQAAMEVAAVKRGLSQQELEGQAALKLIETAAVPIDPNVGQSIDIRV